MSEIIFCSTCNGLMWRGRTDINHVCPPKFEYSFDEEKTWLIIYAEDAKVAAEKVCEIHWYVNPSFNPDDVSVWIRSLDGEIRKFIMSGNVRIKFREKEPEQQPEARNET